LQGVNFLDWHATAGTRNTIFQGVINPVTAITSPNKKIFTTMGAGVVPTAIGLPVDPANLAPGWPVFDVTVPLLTTVGTPALQVEVCSNNRHLPFS